MARGRFITLEGGEGVGKSTQAGLLVDALAARGVPVVATREPGGTPGAEAIRSLLLDGAGDRWEAQAEALLFAAARSDHVARVIAPALARGAWVVCDRFIDSSLAYQGPAVGGAAVRDLHAIGCGGLLPDRTILLDAADGAMRDRIAARDGDASDRIGGRPAAYHATVRAAFRSIAAGEPDRFRLVDAAAERDAVAAAILANLADLLP